MAGSITQSKWSQPHEDDYITKDFSFADGSTLPELKIHYRSLGSRKKNKNGLDTNVVLVLHGTTGNGSNFFRDAFAGQLFNPGQLLSTEDYFIVVPDGIGHGKSSKPSDGLRSKFPNYCYTDMVRAQHLLLTRHLGVNHLRLVIGTSMGGMHTWMWGTMFPDFMDALFPLASLPTEIAGRNRMMRKMAIDSIRNDPEFNGGDYTSPPQGLQPALHVLAWMGSSPLRWQAEAPNRERADQFLDEMISKSARDNDANDFAYAFDASRDYDPRPGLRNIKASLTAVNFADDQVNPPELRILETEIQKVANGTAIVIPICEKTIGHGTHTIAEVWTEHLTNLLERSRRSSSPTNRRAKL